MKEPHRSDTACKRQTCGNERGKAPHSGCNQYPKPHTVCTSSFLAGTSAMHTSGSFWVKTQSLSISSEEGWPGKLLLDCHVVMAAQWAACKENLPAWCSQHHPYSRGMCSQAGPDGATRSSDSFPLLMLSTGSFTTRPDQNFLPCCFLTIPPASPQPLLATAKPSPLLL